METTAQFQQLMSFSDWLLFFGLLGLLASLALIFIFPRYITRRMQAPSPGPASHTDISVLYAQKLADIADRLRNGEITPRECGEEASTCIREFADSVGGDGHSSMTLEEIGLYSGVTGLAEAIGKCYGAEFPKDPQQNAFDAIEECLKVVRRWR